ncbi:MAG: FHA domain-containing protein [Isosphaeraceae bacterium]
MTDQADSVDVPLWIQGDMLFRYAGGGEPERLVKIGRPFGLIGRAQTADVVIHDRVASGSHAYLHLDRGGVHVVDLVTRTGTRINGSDQPVGWIRPGDRIEIAGRTIELLRLRIDGESIEPPPCSDDLLAEAQRPDLPPVSLEPLRSPAPPWVVGSELIFLGWSASCGIQIRDPAVARTHCALARTPAGAFLIDLHGQQCWVEDHLVPRAARLEDGDLLTLGSTRFTARIGRATPHPGSSQSQSLALILNHQRHDALERSFPPTELLTRIDPALVPDQARDSLLSWMVGAIQGGQRQQGEFQIAVTEALRQIQRDSASMLSAHLDRIEKIDREISSLRAEIERRNALPPPPAVEPLRIPRPAPNTDRLQDPAVTTAWLLERVGMLESENRSAWKDLLNRLSPSKKNP